MTRWKPETKCQGVFIKQCLNAFGSGDERIRGRLVSKWKTSILARKTNFQGEKVGNCSSLKKSPEKKSSIHFFSLVNWFVKSFSSKLFILSSSAFYRAQLFSWPKFNCINSDASSFFLAPSGLEARKKWWMSQLNLNRGVTNAPKFTQWWH